ncbi:asparagine synthetase [Candidatus Micrarchaeota archaeon CG11_big_fil_rev_8_21_14_0_20_47_5]|nr:MAG: hypothetical protein AUJ17_01935 [Candidatus Micrarchaeota archaeon CG1_02_47_40]PIN84214.1 MAG: asparagine synthetase [Candidatus Micrarchaeota archaeon CG11_big_fil_rev_8_21_14_0_20_47_5]
MEKLTEKIHSRRMSAVLNIQSTLLNSMCSFLYSRGFTQLMPVILSPITDPLCHSVLDAKIDYCGQELQLTKSMILHKQVAVSSPHLEKIFVLSPNVRLEKPECGPLGKYLIEFSQLDIEMRGAKKRDFMLLAEEMVKGAVGRVLEERKCEIELLGREKLSISQSQFPVYESKEARQDFGEGFESVLSQREKTPFWITDFAREFYDKEDEGRRGYYHNYDLFYPEGFGEALSGAERDFEYGVLKRKLSERGQKEEHFAPYMELARKGKLCASAGGGIGVERLVRWVCGLEHIREASPFAKVPGERFLL